MSTTLLLWIVLIPLFGALLNTILYFYHIKISKLPEMVFSIIGAGTPLGSFLITMNLFLDMNKNNIIFKQELFTWIDIDRLIIDVIFLGDNLSIFMAIFVSFVGWLIHIYAIGYMKGDDGYGKFFAYFNLFLSSMLLLILADNPVIMFIGWEGVGVCSYLLIKFNYKESANVIAGNKAFITNRVGDFGFLLGVITLFFALGETGLSFLSIQENISKIDNTLLTTAGILIFIGAMSKSAQVPLYVWLPDAMAGPTPISALIHAATMVTAGVYIIARFHFLYEQIPNVGLFIAYIGAITALFAAVIATRQNDIKKILAYSHMSQLGYMFIAVGLGFYSTGLFHVFTHAFFKAMLFMGAGAVILAVHHEQDIFKIAQYRKHLPIVGFTFLIGVITISGIPPFSGFFSKDAILAIAFQEGQYLIWVIAVLTAFLTAFYMFRLYFIVFVALNKHKKEYFYTRKTITYPLAILSIGAMLTGFLNFPEIFGGNHFMDSWLISLNSKPLLLSHSTEYFLMFFSVAIATFGIFAAYKKYAKFDLQHPEKEEGIIGNKFYIDELYHILFVKSLQKLSIFVDKVIDDKIIDSFIMNSSIYFVKIGEKISMMQNANIRHYALFMLVGMTSIFIYLYIILGL